MSNCNHKWEIIKEIYPQDDEGIIEGMVSMFWNYKNNKPTIVLQCTKCGDIKKT